MSGELEDAETALADPLALTVLTTAVQPQLNSGEAPWAEAGATR